MPFPEEYEMQMAMNDAMHAGKYTRECDLILKLPNTEPPINLLLTREGAEGLRRAIRQWSES